MLGSRSARGGEALDAHAITAAPVGAGVAPSDFWTRRRADFRTSRQARVAAEYADSDALPLGAIASRGRYFVDSIPRTEFT